MLLLIAACAFVTPEPPATEQGPEQALLDHIAARRDDLLRTDGGVELWRAADAHGTWLRWHTVGAPTPITDDGPLPPDDPRVELLFAPFQWLEEPSPTLSYRPHPVLRGGGRVLHLDLASRRVVQVDRGRGAWQLADHRDVDRLVLPHLLVAPDGTRTVVTRYAWPEASDEP